MIKPKYTIKALLAGVLMLSGALVTQAAEVFIDPPLDDGLGVGDTFEITLKGRDFLAGSSGGGVDIEWDTDVLKIDNSENITPLFSGEGNTTVPIKGTLSEGSLKGLAVMNIHLTEDPNDTTVGGNIGPDFDIANILFTVEGFSDSPTDIIIKPNISNPWTDREIEALETQPDFIGGTVTVEPSVVPLPAAAWFLFSGLFSLAVVGKRTRKRNISSST